MVPGYQIEKRGLPRAVGADDGAQLPFGDGKTDIVENLVAFERFGKILNPEDIISHVTVHHPLLNTFTIPTS